MKLPISQLRQAVTSSSTAQAIAHNNLPKEIQTRQILEYSTIPIISTRWSTSLGPSRNLRLSASKRMSQTLITSTTSSTTCPSRRGSRSRSNMRISAQCLTSLHTTKSIFLMPLPILFRTITIRRSCLLYRRLQNLRSLSNIQISYSSLSCQTTLTTKTSTPS